MLSTRVMFEICIGHNGYGGLAAWCTQHCTSYWTLCVLVLFFLFKQKWRSSLWYLLVNVSVTAGSGVTVTVWFIPVRYLSFHCRTRQLVCFRLVVHLLEVVDGCFSSFVSQDGSSRQSALDAATSLMTSAMPSSVQHQAQTLLATLHPSKVSYHSHKVQFQSILRFQRVYTGTGQIKQPT